MTKSQPGDTFQPGDILNNTYRIEAVLGRGGTSEVYRARSEISGRVVALKVLSSAFSGNEDYLVLMNREEEIRDVRHDAVVRYSENHRTQDGHVYLVMDFIDGPGLDAKMREGGMSADDLMVVAARVAEGLVATHARNIVHRDLSPDNIVLRNGKPAEAVIIDFGIARDTNPGAATIVGNEFAGKYAYAAPEQLSGNADMRSDIYSLGALLLATYRGKAPDVGRNPMEVIQRKGQPLDTEGVPQPLRSLIDRMTVPDPAQRFQTAADVLAAIDPGRLPAPAAARPATEPPKATARPMPARHPAPAGKSSGRSGIAALALILLLLVAAVGAAFFFGLFDSLFGPSYPPAAPYTLLAEKRSGEAPELVGHMPSEEAKELVEARMAALGGSAAVALASGDIGDSWPEDILSLIGSVAQLEEWRIEVSGQTVNVTGMTSDPALQSQVQQSLEGPGMPAAFDGTAEILGGPQILPAEAVDAVLRQHADCGPLNQFDAPAAGYPPGAQVAIRGKVATDATRARIFDGLAAIAGDRPLAVDTEVLNSELCLVGSHLPEAPAGGAEVLFGYGGGDEPNPTGTYTAGDNPVIDVEIPADVTDGYLWVSIIDVTGNVFHLLPNTDRPENSVTALREGRDGPIRVRVAYGEEEAKGDRSRLWFRVDETAGKSEIMVIHSDGSLFPEFRPRQESVGGFAQALKERVGSGDARILSIDSRLMETR